MHDRPSAKSGLTKHQTRQTLASFVWSMSLRNVFGTICGGTTFVFVAFALSLGIKKEQMGYVTSLISLACIIQLMSFPLMNRARHKKRVVLTVALAEPIVMIFAVILVPFVPAHFRIFFFGTAIFVAAASLNLSRPFTDEWIASAIPAGVRGRFLGRNLQIVSAALIVSTLIVGQLAERLGENDTLGMALLLVAGGIFGLLAVIVLRRATMPQVSLSSRVTLHNLADVVRHRPFVFCLLAVTLFNLPFYFAIPYYQVFNLKIIAMRESVIAYMITGYYLVKILALPHLGKLVDRWGSRRTLYVFSPLYVLFFFAFVLCAPDRHWPLLAAWAAVGIADGAFNLAVTTALYRAIPDTPARPAYFAVYNLLSLGTYAVGGTLAVPILTALKDTQFTVGSWHFGQFHCFFGLCALAMIPCILSVQFLPGRKTPARQGSTISQP